MKKMKFLVHLLLIAILIAMSACSDTKSSGIEKKTLEVALWDENARNIKQNSYKGGAMRKKMS